VQRPPVNVLVFWSASLIAAYPVFAQSPVTDIDREVAAAKGRLPSLKKDSVDLTGYSAEGGLAVIYRGAAGPIQLIHVHLFGEGGQSIQDFYFRDGALVLCQEEFHKYNVPITINDSAAKELGTEAFDPKKTEVLHNRYYFRGNDMIQWRKNSRTVVSSKTPEFRETGENLVRFATELFQRYR
jgi:hypothetical protein